MPTLLILAAGMGSRYGRLKQIEPVGPSGETILDYSVYDAVRAGFTKTVFVIRKEIEMSLRDKVGAKYEDRIPCEYVLQELDDLPTGYGVPANRAKPWGTAHAVLVCESVITEPFCVINADDFYGRQAFLSMARFLARSEAGQPEAHCAMVGFPLENTLSEHGSVSRGICSVDDQDRLVSVVERTEILKGEAGIRYRDASGNWLPLEANAPVSMNYWGFTPGIFPQLRRLFRVFLDKSSNDPEAEYYIPSAVDQLIRTKQVSVTVLSSSDQWVGITNPQDKLGVSDHLEKLVRQGVYPNGLW